MLLSLQGEEFLRQAYLRCLDRPADETGLRAYLGQLEAGASRESIIAELEASPEGQRVLRRRGGRSRRAVQASSVAPAPAPDSAVTLLALGDDAAFLGAAYLALFGREVDPSGLENYLSQLSSGGTRDQVLCELATSPEAVAAGRTVLGIDEVLARQAAVVAATPELGTTPPAGHVNELMDLPVESFVKTAYVSVLGREVDPEGLALYSGLLKQGWSRSYVLCELLNSDEGRRLSVTLPGLKGLSRRYAKAQLPSLRGWYHRSVKGAESDLPADRALRAALLAVAR